MKLLHQKITSLRDLTKGSILVNYPTEIASRKPFESILNRDEILFVTDICELGVRGIILNPHNVRTRTQTVDGKKINVVTTRQQETTRKIFVVRDKQLSDCLESHIVPLNEKEVATVTPDWEGIVKSDASSIVQFDSLRFIPIQGVMNGITSGTVQVFKVSNISSLLFSNEISRKMMVSNFYHSLGGEWSFIARSIERVLF